MGCKVNNTVNIHAAVEQDSTVKSVADSLVKVEALNNSLLQQASLSTDSNEKKELLGTVKALKRIEKLKTIGLIMNPSSSSPATNASHSFINSIITSETDALPFVNRLTLDGKSTGEVQSHFRYNENGEVVTDLSASAINSMLKTHYSNTLSDVNKTFVFVDKSGKVQLTQSFLDSHNEAKYDAYLSKIGSIALGNIDNSEDESNTEEIESDEVHTRVDNMISTPVVAHINNRIRAVRKYRADLYREENPVKNRDKIIAANDKIKQLSFTRDGIRTALNEASLFDYFEDALQAIELRVSKLGSIDLSEIGRLKDSIDMINNAKERDDTNRILDRKERQDVELMKSMDAFAARTNSLTDSLKLRAKQLAKEIVEDTAKVEVDDDILFTVGGLSSNASKKFMHILSVNHLKNPIIKIMKHKIDMAVILGTRDAYNSGEKISETYKEAKDAGFNMDSIRQKVDGIQTGNVVDKFSDEYWRNAYALRRDMKNRNKNFLSVNPLFLFDESISEAVRTKHETEIKDLIGEVMYDTYVAEAKKLWEDYNRVKQNMVDSGVPPAKLKEWETFNSPVYRIDNINKGRVFAKNRKRGKKGNTILGSDNYLLILPRKTFADGTSTGFHDEAFSEVENNKAGFNLYQTVREVFAEDEKLLKDTSSLIGPPPQLGYVGKSTWETITDSGPKTVAQDAFRKKIVERYFDVAEDPSAAIDPVTGKPKKKLNLEFSSVPDVIKQEVSRELEKDATFDAMPNITAADMKKRKDYAYKIYLEKAAEIESATTDELLKSLTIANHSRKGLIHKEAVELEINTMLSVIEDSVVFSGDMHSNGTLKDANRRARSTTLELLDHFLAKDFYSQDDADQRTGKTNAGDDWMKVVRLVHLGWSLTSARMNLLQAYTANNIQARQSDKFDNVELHKAYGKIGSKRYRRIMERLDILGAVALDYDNTNMFTDSTLKQMARPMGVHTGIEKVNQIAPMIAMIKSKEVIDTRTGELVPFDSVLTDNATIPSYIEDEKGRKGDELIATFALEVRGVNNKASGNYHTHTLLENSTIGRNAMLFLKFAPEGLADRFSGLDYNIMDDSWTEGRYRSAFNDLKYMVTNRTFQAEEDVVDNKKIAGRRKRAKVALFELAMIGMIYAMSALLRKLNCKTEECKKAHGVVIATINSLNRLAGDMQFASPTSVVEYYTSPFTSETLYLRIIKLSTDVISGEEYERSGRGYKKGDKKWVNSLGKVVPGYYPNIVKVKAEFGRVISLNH